MKAIRESRAQGSSAQVWYVELGLVDITDRNGFFAFDSVPEGRWAFEASGFGYRTNAEASLVGPRSVLLIHLESAPVPLEGFYVSVVRDLVRRRMPRRFECSRASDPHAVRARTARW